MGAHECISENAKVTTLWGVPFVKVADHLEQRGGIADESLALDHGVGHLGMRGPGIAHGCEYQACCENRNRETHAIITHREIKRNLKFELHSQWMSAKLARNQPR